MDSASSAHSSVHFGGLDGNGSLDGGSDDDGSRIRSPVHFAPAPPFPGGAAGGDTTDAGNDDDVNLDKGPPPVMAQAEKSSLAARMAGFGTRGSGNSMSFRRQSSRQSGVSLQSSRMSRRMSSVGPGQVFAGSRIEEFLASQTGYEKSNRGRAGSVEMGGWRYECKEWAGGRPSTVVIPWDDIPDGRFRRFRPSHRACTVWSEGNRVKHLSSEELKRHEREGVREVRQRRSNCREMNCRSRVLWSDSHHNPEVDEETISDCGDLERVSRERRRVAGTERQLTRRRSLTEEDVRRKGKGSADLPHSQYMMHQLRYFYDPVRSGAGAHHLHRDHDRNHGRRYYRPPINPHPPPPG